MFKNFVFKNKIKKIIIILVVIGLFSFFSTTLAQSFGTNEVANGLNNSLNTLDPRTTAGRIINIVLGLLGVIAVGIIIWGGFVYLTSNGEEEKVTKAKNLLKNGVIGLLIILASWGIASFILSKLSGATNGSGSGGSCTNGLVQACGCGGSMSCNSGSWSGCIGSSCASGDVKPTSCDASSNPGCQAANQICASTDYCDSTSCTCKTKGGAGDSCDANLTNGTCDAQNNLCAEFLSCNPSTCVCFGPPVITGISPVGGFCNDDLNKSCTKDFDCGTTCNFTTPNGTTNNFITIYGKNFGTYSASSSRVIFEGTGNPIEGRQPVELNSACVNTWRDNEIVIAVPSGASTGPLKVVNKDNLSDETNNDYGPKINNFNVNTIVRPGLCSLTPDQGVLSDKVNYQGFNLYSGNAYFGNYQSNVQAIGSNFSNSNGLSGSSIIPNIQTGESSSFVVSSLNGNIQSSNSVSFTKNQEVGAGPYIISFSPTKGNAGQYVTIRGSGFGSMRGTSQVYFGNTEAIYDFPDVCLSSVWKDNQIIVKVPANLSNAYQLIKIKIGSTTIDSSLVNPNTFQSDKNLDLLTSVCKIEPDNGPVATPVSLWGENFGVLNSESLVKFSNDKSATGTIVKDGRADLVKTTVPVGAISGPVKVLKKDQSGNEVNFKVGSCAVNSDCGAAQVCCPNGTYRAGRCFGSLESCSSDTPTSVYEWGFSTSFSNVNVDPFSSCAGLAKNLGACQIGATCPNAPGTCSPYAGGNKISGPSCDFSCASVAGCSVAGSNNCSYDSSVNKCVKNVISSACDLSQKFVYNLGGQDKEFTKTCNKDKHWEIITPGSCPGALSSATSTSGVFSNWTRAEGNRCVDLNSTCSSCETGLTCESQNNGANRCVSGLVCPSGSSCEKNNDESGAGKCISKDEATCSCCCQIGHDAQDCCAPLKCSGTCGSDTTDDGVGLGKCGGCATVGSTTAEHDAACSCTGHSGQYCDINSTHPQGVCADCTGLSNKQNCDDHSAACCFDSKRTATIADDSCRGGSGTKITQDKINPNFGYCAYYNCQNTSTNPAGDSKLCASTTPVKLGFFTSIDKCTSTSTGCFSNVGADYCSLFSGDQGACLAEAGCCFDKNNSKCKGGEKISTGTDKGYCAYYNCQTGNNKLCNLLPSATGTYSSITSCSTKCANQEGGAGLSCAGKTATSSCAFNTCNITGFNCLTSSGGLGLLPDCGTCCCQPGLVNDSCKTDLTPNLHCQADKGNCSGAGRGLCCGCTKDSDCGYTATTGCGINSCCEARPQIEAIVPAHLASGVCRNTVAKVSFNQSMDASSVNNLILLEEKDSGLCQSGYLADNSIQKLLNNQKTTVIAKVYNNLHSIWNKIISHLAGQALADIPSSDKIYCLVAGNTQIQDITGKSTLTFSPKNVLNPKTNYYLVVLGDENLNSQSGVISATGIGFNGEGYFDASRNAYVEGELLKFNNKVYKNARLTKFTTLDGVNSICKVDHVTSLPDSYLFSSTVNSLDEKDSDPTDQTFDTVNDKDKVFTALAYSSDNQLLQPVTNYFWDWNWQIENTQVATITPVIGLRSNQAFISAISGVTDDNTKLTASINMRRFQTAYNNCNSSINCACTDANCSNNCCNDSSAGDSKNSVSNLYVFLCQNPWPPVAPNGSWSPWNDNCAGSISGTCSNYNYKFYYCRDSGDNTTLDDLPAIINQAVIRGQSTNSVCSTDRLPCSNLGGNCGQDKDGNGVSDGVCIWNVLKESYFFREATPQGGQIISAYNTLIGDSISVAWRAEVSQAASFKVYYLKSGSTATESKTVTATSSCSVVGTFYNCNTTIGNLTKDTSYVFKVSAISAAKTENLLYGELSATPNDQTPPNKPIGLQAEIKNNKLLFTWTANNDKTNSYILYHGAYSLSYGESYPSAVKANSIEFDADRFGFGNHFFALSAVDVDGNESGKSVEINFVKTSCATAAKPKCINFDFFQNILTNIDFEHATANGLPTDWSSTYQQRSSIKISQNEFLSGQQSVLLHQDAGYEYPGHCSQKQCNDTGACTWDVTNKTCNFPNKDDCHPDNPAVYKEGETLCWGQSNRVMWLALAYSLAKLNFNVGDHYAINFYYKGKAITDVNVGLTAAMGWSSFCVPYSYVNALKPEYIWKDGAVYPTPPAGVDPSSGNFGPSCSEQANTICYMGPAQKKCYSGNYMPSIGAGNYNNWTWYYYPFDYTKEMSSWVDRSNNKLIEIGMAMGYNPTLNGATDLYIDDFTVRKVATSTQVNN